MKNNSNTDVKNVAKHYRDVLGFNVIPLKAGRKVPALPKGHPYLYRQGTDKEFESFDFRNVGIVTGQTSGIVVLDVDEEGPNTLREKDWTCSPDGNCEDHERKTLLLPLPIICRPCAHEDWVCQRSGL
jgi:hypothetical protein